MDKSWIQLDDRWSPEYIQGLEVFIELAKKHVDKANRLRCPCRRCNNVYYWVVNIVVDHLYCNGMDKGYICWVHHGEDFETVSSDHDTDDEGMTTDTENNFDQVQEIIEDIHMGEFMGSVHEEGEASTSHNPRRSEREAEKFARLLRDAQRELYPGCENFSKLSFLVKLLHIKTISRWSNKSFNMVIELFKEALPVGETLPKSYYEAKRSMRDLGLGYEAIHACVNDCVLFWKEHENKQECPKCGESRWKYDEGKKKKIPKKVLRYFPLKSRLQRLYLSRKTAADMRWHTDKRKVDENVLIHPADSQAWKEFDKKHEWFAEEPRNVRLGLATDGFNPFGNMSNSYSMWPVILMPYNLPPWKCMKEPFLMMSLLIPGPKSPGNDIDVYLRPLIDELKELWEFGVETYDASKEQNFQMHAAVLWTINDFPAYANLSGWSTKGFLACPTCNKETCSLSLKSGRKICYMGHRRYLASDHNWRKKTTIFDGKEEHRLQPKNLSGDDILEQLNQVQHVNFGKTPNTKKRKRTEAELNWTKKSIFFDLPYWRTLKVRHTLDVMHIEKNICDNVLGTLMNIDGKTKDSVKARLDMEAMGIRKELHLKWNGTKFEVPLACYTLSNNERKGLCEWLKSVKYPDGYASNISRCVSITDHKISGMKSHDCHVFLQRLLPIVARGHLRKDVCTALVELSIFFKELCCRSLKLDVLERLEMEIALILCKLERIFPPAFFDVMVHLAIHLPRQLILAGPVQYIWMYPIERYLHTLKLYVRNKARPEGSIAEGYIDKECLTFCSMYLRGIETRFNREERNYDGGHVVQPGGLSVFSQSVRTLGSRVYEILKLTDQAKVRWYVLNNCHEIEIYLNEHMEDIKRQSSLNVNKRHQEEFPKWFEKRMKLLRSQNSLEATDQLYSLACGPDPRGTHYTGCIVNGIRFHTKEREKHRRTQNSGVVVQGDHNSEEADFFGVLTDVIELSYCGGNHVVLLKCDWWDTSNVRTGIRRDGHFTSVNMSRKWYKDDPFVLASQVGQVFYLSDTKLGGLWHVVQNIQPRNLYDVPEVEEEDTDEVEVHEDDAYQLDDPYVIDGSVDYNYQDLDPLDRNDGVPDYIDATVMEQHRVEQENNDSFINDSETDEDEAMLEYCTDQEGIVDSGSDSDLD